MPSPNRPQLRRAIAEVSGTVVGPSVTVIRTPKSSKSLSSLAPLSSRKTQSVLHDDGGLGLEVSGAHTAKKFGGVPGALLGSAPLTGPPVSPPTRPLIMNSNGRTPTPLK